jgi:crotonobetainyl-CoA:carnitine CoA-transferase CaiB-like acyl-CoA transferase
MESEAPRSARASAPLAGIIAVERASADCPLDVRLSLGLAGRMLADLGAEVIKLEPPEGDPLRAIGPKIGRTSALFAFLNAGKKFVCVGSDAHAEARIIARSDALLRDPVPAAGAPSRVEAIASLLPDDGRRQEAGSEFTLLARSGLLDIVGDPNREPLQLGGHQLAYGVGLALFAGIVASLAEEGGGIETVRANFLDTGTWLNWKGVIAPSWGAASPRRQGDAAEWRTVRCADGWVALVHRQDEWAALKALCDDPRLDDPRFQKRAERRRHSIEVSAIVEEHLRRYSRHEIRAMTLANRLPLGPVWTVGELREDTQYEERGFLVPVRLPDGAQAVVPRIPVIWGDRIFAPGALDDIAASVPEGVR